MSTEPHTLPTARLLRSNWQEAIAMLPDVGRLLRTLASDPRVPWRAKAVAGAAAGYVLFPRHGAKARSPGVLAGGGVGVDDVLVVLLAVRHLVAAAGYDVVRERWAGSDAGFALLVVLAGVAR